MLRDHVIDLFWSERSRVLHNSRILNKMIRAESLMRYEILNHQVCKSSNMAACLPYLWVHENCAFNFHHVGAACNVPISPCCLQVFLEKNSHRTKVICSRKSAVNIRRRKNKAFLRGKVDDGFKIGCHSGWIVAKNRKNHKTQHLFLGSVRICYMNRRLCWIIVFKCFREKCCKSDEYRHKPKNNPKC